VCTIVITEQFAGGLTSWSDVTFDYQYTPTDPYSTNKNYTVLLDGHSHTYYSDGSLSPEQSIQWHLANGFNAMVVSEHNAIDGGIETRDLARKKYNDKMKVLVAQEYSCCRIHMNLVNIKEAIEATAWPTDEELQRVINETHNQGGFVIMNHRPWSLHDGTLKNHPTLEQLRDWGVDYFDVAHENIFDLQAYQFAVQSVPPIGIITATDLHTPSYGVNGWTTLNPKKFH